MPSIVTNMPSMTAQRNLSATQTSFHKAVTRHIVGQRLWRRRRMVDQIHIHEHDVWPVGSGQQVHLPRRSYVCKNAIPARLLQERAEPVAPKGVVNAEHNSRDPRLLRAHLHCRPSWGHTRLGEQLVDQRQDFTQAKRP